jgi:sensor histidine kinase YesM
MAAANVAAAVFVAVAFFGVGLRTPWRQATEPLAIAFLFSSCIGTTCAIVIPRVTPRLWRLRFPLNWVVLVLLMFVFAMAGSAVAIGTLIAVGYLPASLFDEWFAGSAKVAILTTLTFGIAVSAYELMRARLDKATLALRTKERDEAEARRLATEAQLASLESRVQPHFLFNTLNSIVSLIHDDPRGAEKMTGQLASLLRSSLDNAGATLVPLEQELKTVRDYLDIEHVRFGDRLRYHVEADERVRGAMVPRLSLQTLVENGVKYAVTPRRDGGSIVVRATSHDGCVRLEVEDNGPGFDPAALPANHGLALLGSRLALTFGERATLAIESVPGRTRVTIEVPQ